MDEFVQMPREPHSSCDLPKDRQTAVWRYMDYWKFKDLVEHQRLHLVRADKLEDRFEATYSRAQLLEMDRWLMAKGYEQIATQEKKRCEIIRKKFYLSCWCMHKHDLDLMWKAYTIGCRDAVAVQSRVARMEAICDKFWSKEFERIDVSRIKYVRHREGHFIEYSDGFSTVVRKDCHFRLDREIRIIYWPNQKEPYIESYSLPVELSVLIERVVLAPGADSRDAERIRELMDSRGLQDVPVESSRYDRHCEMGV